MRLAVLLLFLVLGPFCAARPSRLDAARHAQSLLGDGTWSQLLRIRNDGEGSRYAKTVYALIFEFASILWFYTETEGTQSFSLYKNRLEEEKADLLPGLKEIDPGFSAFTPIPVEKVDAVRGSLPNGCFIESLVAGRDQLGRGDPILSAQLLLYHVAGVRQGHCVFVYQTPRGFYVIDSAAASKEPKHIGMQRPRSSKKLAALVWGQGPERAVRVAKTVDFPHAQSGPALWASIQSEKQGTIAADLPRDT